MLATSLGTNWTTPVLRMSPLPVGGEVAVSAAGEGAFVPELNRVTDFSGLTISHSLEKRRAAGSGCCVISSR